MALVGFASLDDSVSTVVRLMSCACVRYIFRIVYIHFCIDFLFTFTFCIFNIVQVGLENFLLDGNHIRVSFTKSQMQLPGMQQPGMQQPAMQLPAMQQPVMQLPAMQQPTTQ